jgi:membrane protease YdiL (CAAX protease family)
VTPVRPGTALLVYLLVVFIGAALLAPWIYFGLQHFDATGIPFRRVVDRCLLGLALIGIWPLIKALPIQSASEIGLRTFSARDVERGFVFGSLLLLSAATAALASGAARWDPAFSLNITTIASALLPAITVPILEEILFRGAIFSSLRKTWNTSAALWISSAIYAIVHFFARPENPTTVQWNSGFTILGGMLAGFADLHTVIPGFLSLTLLGVLLALAFLKTSALYLSMGIHAALVFWIKVFSTATNPVPTANLWFWGTDRLIDGWFSFFLLALATAVFAKWRLKTRAP